MATSDELRRTITCTYNSWCMIMVEQVKSADPKTLDDWRLLVCPVLVLDIEGIECPRVSEGNCPLAGIAV